MPVYDITYTLTMRGYHRTPAKDREAAGIVFDALEDDELLERAKVVKAEVEQMDEVPGVELHGRGG